MDMHSGGGLKIDGADRIFIEGPEGPARELFTSRFDRDPDNVTCECCGEDYSVSEYSSLEQATGFDRGARWSNKPNDGREGEYVEKTDPRWETARRCFDEYQTLEEYLKSKGVLVVRAGEVK